MADEHRKAEREIGRSWAYELQQAAEAAGRPFDWFEGLYDRAGGDSAFIPWEMAAPRFKLKQWLTQNPGQGLRALDVGCGLGDNARLLADAGYDVLAFDIAPSAVAWARERQTDRPTIAFETADLLNPPQDWLEAFDLVHETYNLQAMPQGMVGEAVNALAALVKPGGSILLITRVHDLEAEQPPKGPPWPLTTEQLAKFADAGLAEVASERFDDERDPPIPHVLKVFRKQS